MSPMILDLSALPEEALNLFLIPISFSTIT